MSWSNPTDEEIAYLAKLDVIRSDGFDRTGPALARMVIELRNRLCKLPPPEWLPAGPHYVVLTEFDTDPAKITARGEFDKYGQWHPWGFHQDGPIVGEVYVGPATTIDGARDRAAQLRGMKYGRVAIARLAFDVEG